MSVKEATSWGSPLSGGKRACCLCSSRLPLHTFAPPPPKHAHLVLDRVPVKNVKRTALGVDVNQQRIKLLALLEGPYLVL